jgi:hypothetical protein
VNSRKLFRPIGKMMKDERAVERGREGERKKWSTKWQARGSVSRTAEKPDVGFEAGIATRLEGISLSPNPTCLKQRWALRKDEKRETRDKFEILRDPWNWRFDDAVGVGFFLWPPLITAFMQESSGEIVLPWQRPCLIEHWG